jgi:hypothetical protein
MSLIENHVPTRLKVVTRAAPPLPRWERIAQAAVGVGFGGAAVVNVFGFLPRAHELLPWFAETAWLPPYGWVLHHLLPAAPLVVVAGAAFEATVAAMLLTQRRVPLALGLAAGWMLGLVPAIGWPYWTTNVVPGIVVVVLAVRAARRGGREWPVRP